MKVLFAVAALLASVSALPHNPVKFYPDARCPRFDSPDILVILPHRVDCSKFLTCVSGLAFEMRCPEGLEFSPVEKNCNYPQLAQCRRVEPMPFESIKSNVPETTQAKIHLTRPASEHTTQEVVTVQGAKGIYDPRCLLSGFFNMPIVFSYFGDCRKFIMCSGGMAFVVQCPGELIFNAEKRRCDAPETTECPRWIDESI